METFSDYEKQLQSQVNTETTSTDVHLYKLSL